MWARPGLDLGKEQELKFKLFIDMQLLTKNLGKGVLSTQNKCLKINYNTIYEINNNQITLSGFFTEQKSENK